MASKLVKHHLDVDFDCEISIHEILLERIENVFPSGKIGVPPIRRVIFRNAAHTFAMPADGILILDLALILFVSEQETNASFLLEESSPPLRETSQFITPIRDI